MLPESPFNPSSDASPPPPPPGGRADDYALMEGIRRRDDASLSALYDAYGGAVYGLCLRALRDTGEAEDLLIDIFWEIWDRADRFDPSRGSPVGYVLGLARSRVIDRLRSRRSRARAGIVDGGAMTDQAQASVASAAPGPSDVAEAVEQRARVVRALAQLPPEQRQALELAYFDAMSHTEVAERLNEPLGTVKSRIRQALIRLRGVLGGDA